MDMYIGPDVVVHPLDRELFANGPIKGLIHPYRRHVPGRTHAGYESAEAGTHDGIVLSFPNETEPDGLRYFEDPAILEHFTCHPLYLTGRAIFALEENVFTFQFLNGEGDRMGRVHSIILKNDPPPLLESRRQVIDV